MSSRFTVPALLAMLSVCSFSSFAEDVVPTVVVSATRSATSNVTVPATIHVITREDIQNSGATNVVEILSAHSGLQVNDFYSDGAYASVTMRGLSSTSNVLILVDGRRLNNVDLSSPRIGAISVNDIERIEIIQGSAGTIFGDQAVGGVINIITRAEQSSSSATLATGSYGRRRVQVSTGDKLTDNLSYRFSADILHADNYRDNSSVNDKNAFARLSYLSSSGKYYIEYQQSDTFHELPGSLLASEIAQNRRQSHVDFAEDFIDSSINVVRAGIQRNFNETWSLEMEATSRDEDLSIQQSFRGSPSLSPSAVDNNQRELTPRLIGAINTAHGETLVTLGADLIDTKYESAITSIVDNQKQNSVYAQIVYPFAKQLSLTLGARHSAVTDDVISTYKVGEVKADVTVGELGLSWQASEALRIFTRVDQNFRFAKVDEFTYTSPGVELRPQTGNSAELGMQWNRQGHRASVTVYHLALEDEIAFDSGAPQPVGGFFPGANVNFDPTTHDGLIVDAYYPVTDQVSLNSSFSYSDARFDSGVYQDNRIPAVIPRVLTLAPEFNNGKGFVSRLEFIYNDRSYVDSDFDNVLEKKAAYSLVNASVTVKHKEWRAALRINNLLNRTYNEYQNSWGAITPANEINFWLSLTVDIE